MTAAARRPSLAVTLATVILCALFVRLGFWQWGRGVERQAQHALYERGQGAAEPLAGDAGVPTLYRRVTVSGQLDGAHQFLLDYRSHRGLPGYEVLTPLTRPGAAALLIDRGWVPFTGSRQQLPDVAVAASAPVNLSGRLAPLPSAGLELGRAPPAVTGRWPRVTAFPTLAELERAYGAPLATRILLLDPSQPYGYVRDWQPPGLAPARHFAYAVQWWCFALAAFLIWALVGFRRGRARP